VEDLSAVSSLYLSNLRNLRCVGFVSIGGIYEVYYFICKRIGSNFERYSRIFGTAHHCICHQLNLPTVRVRIRPYWLLHKCLIRVISENVYYA